MAGPVLVTGATGLVGHAIAAALLEQGQPVRVLVRDPERAASMVPAGVEPVVGDVTDPSTLVDAMAGCDLVFHAAGLPEQALEDESQFDRVNHVGTVNVLAAAKEAGVRRVVHTSTMDVFGAPRGGTLVETQPDPNPKGSAYGRSKVAAEGAVDKAVADGLDVVVVNPGGVYGPNPVGPVAFNRFFDKAGFGFLPMVPPGGQAVVSGRSLARAHLLAAERGRTGERYLVADEYVTFHQLAGEVGAIIGRRVPPAGPAIVFWVAAWFGPVGKRVGIEPLLTTTELRFLLWNVRLDTTKAREELGFTPAPLADGVRETIDWLRTIKAAGRN